MSSPPIPTARLGSTELVVSRIGLGLAALGRPAYINIGRQRDFGSERSLAALERRCHEVLDAAYASGIRYFDAARSYGMAENFLRTWLKTRNPAKDAITIGSKWTASTCTRFTLQPSRAGCSRTPTSCVSCIGSARADS